MMNNPDDEPQTYRGTVWKYELEIRDIQYIDMPVHARPLSAQFQGVKLVLWCLVCPQSPVVRHTVHVLGTGHLRLVDTAWQYVSTVQEPGTPLVWHVFFDGGE